MNDIKIKMPNDIKRYIWLRIGMRLLACLLGNAAVTLILLYYKDKIAGSSVSAQVLIYTIPFILVFLATGVPLKLLDHTWCGTIENVRVREVLVHQFGRSYRVPGRGVEYGNVVELDVKLDSGKTIRCSPIIKPLKNLQSIDFYTSNFKSGDRVVHIYLTNFVQRLPDEETKLKNCVICGEVQHKDHDKCEACGHSLTLTESEAPSRRVV